MRGDEAFETFVSESSSGLFRAALLLTGGDEATAEDLMQDAYLVTLRHWDRIREPGSRTAYVRRVLTRLAYKKSSRYQRERQVLARAPRPREIPEHSAGIAHTQDLWEALSHLSGRQRAVVVLRYYEDRTEAETAAILGCSVGTVKSHASRALRAMDQHLGRDYLTSGSQEERT